MIRGLYITVENVDDFSSGVVKKICMQKETFINNGLDITIVSSHKTNALKDLIQRFLPFSRRDYVEKITQKIKSLDLKEYQYVYFRYFSSGIDSIKLLAYIKQANPKIKIICEFPTFPYDHELIKIQFIPWLIKDMFWRNNLKKYIDLATTYSNVAEIYNIPCIELFNGYNIGECFSKSYKEKKADEVVCIGVGNISEWHGYEKIIKGIKRYKGKKKIVFHIVGEGLYKKKLLGLVRELNLEENVIFDGRKSGDELLALYEISDIAIGSLSANLMKCNHISPLKTREYCAMGVPFLYTNLDYIFHENAFPYAMEVSEDESVIEMENVILFLDELHKLYTDEQITNNMREFAKDQLSWDKSLLKVFKYIRNNEI